MPSRAPAALLDLWTRLVTDADGCPVPCSIVGCLGDPCALDAAIRAVAETPPPAPDSDATTRARAEIARHAASPDRLDAELTTLAERLAVHALRHEHGTLQEQGLAFSARLVAYARSLHIPHSPACVAYASHVAQTGGQTMCLPGCPVGDAL